jgi:hypothetical protein
MPRLLAASFVVLAIAASAMLAFPARGQDATPVKEPQTGESVIEILPADAVRNESLVLKALELPVSLTFDEVPLREFVRALRRKLGISIVIDEVALKSKEVPLDETVSVDVSRVTLRSALELALEPLKLRAVVQYEVLLITPLENALEVRQTAVYDVTDLVQNREDGTSERLVKLLEESTGGKSLGPWDNMTGSGGVTSALSTDETDLLVVSQTNAVQRQVDRLLTEAIAAVEAEEAPDIAAGKSTVERRLRRRVSVDFDDINWRFAVQTIASRIGVPVQIEPTGTGDAPTVTLKAENVRASSLLTRILAPRQLGFVATDAGVRIAPLETLDQQIETRIYDLRWFRTYTEKDEPDFTALIKALQSIEEARPGTDEKREGKMEVVPLPWSRPVLVVKDTRERQTRIARLLGELRATRAWPAEPWGVIHHRVPREPSDAP